MARVKLTEYRAKSLLLGEGYGGVAIRTNEDIAKLSQGNYVFKVDQGVKKRMKQGLVALNVAPKDMATHLKEWEKKGFTSFIAEPMLPHEESAERYVSFERVRDGIRVLYAKEGGIEIEAHPEKVQRFTLSNEGDVVKLAEATGTPESFVRGVMDAFAKEFLAFIEINPLVVRDGDAHLLDAALLVDSAGQFFAKGWGMQDVVAGKARHEAEESIEALAATTPASLKLSVINPNGSLFFLLSGGGGSIVIADQAQLAGFGKEIANYGEYSGGPTREETYLYTKEVVSLILASKAKKKALVIAGGVANFTDVKATFAGIIDALAERADTLRKAGVRVFVRRGGPNEAAGLAHMEAFLCEEKLLGSIYGSGAVITSAIDDAVAYLKS